jgi:hypothetical protein
MFVSKVFGIIGLAHERNLPAAARVAASLKWKMQMQMQMQMQVHDPYVELALLYIVTCANRGDAEEVMRAGCKLLYKMHPGEALVALRIKDPTFDGLGTLNALPNSVLCIIADLIRPTDLVPLVERPLLVRPVAARALSFA